MLIEIIRESGMRFFNELAHLILLPLHLVSERELIVGTGKIGRFGDDFIQAFLGHIKGVSDQRCLFLEATIIVPVDKETATEVADLRKDE